MSAFRRTSSVPVILAAAILAGASIAFAQADTEATGADGLAPLADGTMVTQPLETSDLLVHLGLIGWGFAFETETPFTAVTLAVVAMERAHPDATFQRVPLGGALTVRRPEPSTRADLALLLDARDDDPQLTLRVGDDTSIARIDPPALLQAPSGTVRRPYATGQVVPRDPAGRFILMDRYPDAADGVTSTGDVADMLAYLAVEVRVE